MAAKLIIVANYALFIAGCGFALLTATPTDVVSTMLVLAALAAGAGAHFALTRKGARTAS
jgi:hypothetical protein